MKWGFKTLALCSVLGIGILSVSTLRGAPIGYVNRGSIQGANVAQNHEQLSKTNTGYHSFVMKDIAHTAALCVQDCRSNLTQLSNQLVHAKNSSEKQFLLQQMIKQHPQFMSLTLLQTNRLPIHVGQEALHPELEKQACERNTRDQTFISHLYKTNRANAQIAMTVGVPVVNQTQRFDSLVAEVNMHQVMQVMQMQDSQFHTKSRVLSFDGQALTFHDMLSENNRTRNDSSKHPIRSDSMNQAKVAGTNWYVHVTSLPKNSDRWASRRENEVLVRFNRDLTQAELQQACKAIHGKLVRSNSRHTYIFQSNHASVSYLIRYFKGVGAVIAEPHYQFRTNQLDFTFDTQTEEPNDTFYSTYQWNLVQISSDLAWVKTRGSSKVTVAVVDTGVDLNHPDLAGRLTNGRNVLDTSKPPQDDNGHGTHVAGIIGARTNNHEGIAGINWRSKIMPVKVMGKDGSGSVVDIADGIVWAADHGADVINLSLGEYEDSDYLHEAIRYAYNKGVVIVSAMGNDGTNKPCYPAAYKEVIAVAANDNSGTSANFSNFGPDTSVTAPGVAIPSTYPNNHYVTLSGTSMASPHVAGVAALIKSVNPALSPSDIRMILQKTADDLGPTGRDDHFGYGQVNANRAIVAAQDTIK